MELPTDLPTVLSELLACLRSLEETGPGRPFGHAAVQVDRQVLQRAAVYHGGVLKSTSDGASGAVVYDGLDTTGEVIDYFLAAGASYGDTHIFERGIALRVGLYVDLGNNVGAFTVYYQPVPREKR